MESTREGLNKASSQEKEAWDQSGGKTLAAPGFSLTASPIQRQAAPQGPSTVAKVPASSGGFVVGSPTRPSITHDNGFLDAFDEVTGKGDEKYKERGANLSDLASLAYWNAKLEGAKLLRPDLFDGLMAYDHFLHQQGADRNFSYDRYADNDPSGASTVNDAILHTIKQAEVLCPQGQTVQITSRAFTTGQSGPFSIPYPNTENWQKAIGGHSIWISATIKSLKVNNEWTYAMSFTLHAEDRYNFNPGQKDIATGTADAENGIFEITKLAYQYTQYAELSRNVAWKSGSTGNPSITKTSGR